MEKLIVIFICISLSAYVYSLQKQVVSLTGTYNAAFGKTTYQSSNFQNNDDSSKVVDGDTDSCSSTDAKVYTWWSVDLGDIHNVHGFNITNTFHDCADSLRDFGIYGSNISYYPKYAKDIKRFYRQYPPAWPGETVSFYGYQPINARYIIIYKRSNKTRIHCPGYGNDDQGVTSILPLILCEVVVQADCLYGFYGLGCKNKCSSNCIYSCKNTDGGCIYGACKPGYKGDNCTVHCPDGTFGANCINKIMVWPQGIYNAALYKQTYQSSYFEGLDNSARAVDGNRNSLFTENSCTHTDESSVKSWWAVDLGSINNIYGVTVTNRQECPERLHNFDIYISNSTYIPTSRSDIKLCTSQLEEMHPGESKLFNCSNSPIQGRYLIINKTSTYHISSPNCSSYEDSLFTLRPTALTLCEVEVHADCLDGYYGLNCNDTCPPSCKRYCKKTDGACIKMVCATGYKGQYCDIECPDGTYGENCSLNCSTNCLHQPCDKFSSIGNCPASKCIDGYVYEGNCTTPCKEGYYGANCVNSVLSLQNGIYNAALHKKTFQSSNFGITENSFKAVDGNHNSVYSGNSCTQTTDLEMESWWVVDLGYLHTIHGVKITNRLECHWLQNFEIFMSNKTYTPNETDLILCALQIEQMQPGESKLFKCSNLILARYVIIKQINPTRKNLQYCSELPESHQLGLSLCEVEVNADCLDGFYGYNCAEKCPPNCFNSCDKSNGMCFDYLCKPGFTGDKCNEECQGGTYGQSCSNCSTNCLYKLCNKFSLHGDCLQPKCIDGYQYHGNCTTPCPKGTYGANCINKLISWPAGIYNVALNKPTYQSSDYKGIKNSFKAVDGNSNSFYGGDSCTQTDSTSLRSWWAVDLGDLHRVFSITITNQLNCPERLHNFAIYMSNTSYIPVGATDLTLCESQLKEMHPGESKLFNCSEPIYARYIIINKTSSEHISSPNCSDHGFPYPVLLPTALTLCEVEVHSECLDGYYGFNCNKQCPFNCATSCNKTNGECLYRLCKPGYIGNKCELECSPETYGVDCYPCSTNCLYPPCDKFTIHGTCPEEKCIDGFKFQGNCTTQCEKGTYGLNCVLDCPDNCANSLQCNYQTGTCDYGCKSGYTGETCDGLCPDGTFGNECSNVCSSKCLKSRCNKFHDGGACLEGCITGYKGTFCNETCNFGTYGDACSQSCPHCLTKCDVVTGDCSAHCDIRYTGGKCNNVCTGGYFGWRCENICNCRDNEHCNFKNGSCPKGCQDGFTGQQCQQQCAKGFYGIACKNKCMGHCQGDAACDHITGTCQMGCENGYDGKHCDISKDISTINDKAFFIGCICAIIIILSLIIVEIYSIIKFWKVPRPCGLPQTTFTILDDTTSPTESNT